MHGVGVGGALGVGGRADVAAGGVAAEALQHQAVVAQDDAATHVLSQHHALLDSTTRQCVKHVPQTALADLCISAHWPHNARTYTLHDSLMPLKLNVGSFKPFPFAIFRESSG